MWESLRSYLERHEVENQLILGVLASAPEGTRPVVIERDGQIRAACLFVERNLVAAGEAEYAEELVAGWRGDVPGIVARADLAEAWAQHWGRQRGCRFEVAYEQRIYQLEAVVKPRPVAGSWRLAERSDFELLKGWIEAFDREALAQVRLDLESVRRSAALKCASGMTYLWEVEGNPVSMASLARPTQQAIGVNLVFTPEAYRGTGYASAVVAAVSQEGLSRGYRYCALYTDLANPTSNSIYQKLGYRPVCDSRQYLFHY